MSAALDGRVRVLTGCAAAGHSATPCDRVRRRASWQYREGAGLAGRAEPQRWSSPAGRRATEPVSAV